MNPTKLKTALELAQKYDERGMYDESDFLMRALGLSEKSTRTAQTDENLLGKIGNAVSNGGYAIQNWGANALLGGGQNAQRVVEQITEYINQMQSNAFLRDPNQKSALIATLQQARQIAAWLATGSTSNPSSQAAQQAQQSSRQQAQQPSQQQAQQQPQQQSQQQAQQQKESELASQYLTPEASAATKNIRTADDRSIPVVVNDLQNLINFANQAYADRDQQQVSSLLAVLGKARSIMLGQGGYYSPSPSMFPQENGTTSTASATSGNVEPALDPTRLNAQQKEFLDKYMRIGIARGPDAMNQEMNSNPYHTAPFKAMVTKFWDEQVGPKLALRKQMMQAPLKSA